MEVRVLGPVELVAEDGPVALGALKQRRLLSALVVHAGEARSADLLIDAIWGPSPPASAAKLLQTYVSQLRKALPAPARIRTRGVGYALELGDESLDAARFERLLSQGRAASRGGNPALAASLLRRALGLWRGQAYGDFAYEEFARGESERLEELRLAALEERIEAELALGRHDELLPELRSFAGAYPRRERLQAQAMLALYRCGRQSEALEVYAAARVHLHDELGLEPGAELRELQRRILQQDPGLVAAPRAEEALTRLPIPPNALLGRERELGELRQLLVREDVRLLVLTGAGGSGKTRLALQAARETAQSFANGAAFVNLAPLRDPTLVVGAIARVLGIPDVSGEDSLQTLADALGPREMLLVVDNAEHVRAAAPSFVELLARAPHLTLLVTSRVVLHVSGEQVYSVEPLAVRAAVALFTERAREAEPRFQLSSEDEPAIRRICRRLDGLPLAVELAASRTRTLTPSELLARLEPRLPLLTGGPRDLPARQQTLRATLEWSYDLLEEEERILFARLSVFAGGCTLPAAEQVCEANLDTLQSLIDKNLLRRDGERFTMLETIREYAAERLVRAGDLEKVRRRHAVFFVEFADAAEAAFDWRDEAGWYGAVEREHANMDSALVHSYESSDFTSVLRIASGAWRYWLARRPEEGQQWIERAMSDSVESPLRERAVFALAWFTLIRGEFARSKALGEQLRTRAEAADDEVGRGRALNLLAFTAREEGDLDRACDLATESLSIARENDDDATVAVRLANLGTFERTQGAYTQAAEHLEESIAIARRHGIEPYYALSQLALVEIGRDNVARALPLLKEALRRLAGSLDTRNTVQALEAVAVALAASGDVERASRLRDAADAARESSGLALDSDDSALRTATVRAIEEQLETPTRRETQAKPMPLDDAVAYALEASP